MIHMVSTLPILPEGASTSTWIAVCRCGWGALQLPTRQLARERGERHLDETNRTYCLHCGHVAGDHALLSTAATSGGLGQLCQRAGCLCTGYVPDTEQ